MRSVVPFGAFVELLQQQQNNNDDDDDDDDSSSRHHHHRRRHSRRRPFQALVHASAVSEETSRLSRDDTDEDKRRAIEFFAPVGSKVWVKIVEVKEQEGGAGGALLDRHGGLPPRPRVSASMRAVSQQDGADLDPEGKMMSVPGGFDARGGGGAGGGEGGRNDNKRGGGGGGGGRNRPLSPPGDAPLSPHPPAVGSILRARVASTTKFGAFVLLEGFAGKGLVHITQIAEGLDMARLREATDEEREAAVREMLPPAGDGGGEILVKVVDVVAAREDEATGALLPAKVSCSVKVVDQATGEDLDPTGERAKGAGGGGGGGGAGGGGAKAAAAAVGAAAGAVARQGDAVEWGHLAAERYKGASGKDYDLVQETPEEAAAAAAAAVAAEEAAQRAEEELLRAASAGGNALPPPPPPPAITSVEAALAVLEQLGGGGGGKKHRKDKRKKEKKRGKKAKEKKKKHRKEKRRSRSYSSSSSSSSSSSGSQ